MVVNVLGDSTGQDILVLDLDSAGAVRPLAATPALEWGAIFSPDGKWVAYSSGETGNDEIYVQPWPMTGRRWRISRNGGEEPLWTRGGRELVYQFGEEWWRVDLGGTAELDAGEPRLLARGNWINVAGYEYAASADGERLYLLAPLAGPATATQLSVISNWLNVVQDVTRRVGRD